MTLKKTIGTPEFHMQCPAGEIDTDAIYRSIFRAQSVLSLLHSNFEESGGSRLADDGVIYAIDAVNGCLDQINILLTEA